MPRSSSSSRQISTDDTIKMSKAEEKQLLQEFMTDTEDDDDLDDLLRGPPTFSKSKKGDPQANDQAEAEAVAAAAAATAFKKSTARTGNSPNNNNNETKSLLERATETARIFLKENISSDSNLIPSFSSDLLWLKKGKSNSVKWWPVLLPANQDTLEAVNDHLLQRKSKKHVIVCYLGMKVPHRGEIETVHSNNLFPFDHVDQRRQKQRRSASRSSKSKGTMGNAKTSTSTDADSPASKDDGNGNGKSDHMEARTKQWSQPNMDNYLKRLRTSILSKKDNVELCLLTEQVYLQLLLEHVLEVEQRKQQEQNNNNNESAAQAESEDEEDDLVLSASPDDSKAYKDGLDVTNAAQVTQDEEATSPPPPAAAAPHNENPSNSKAARPAKKQVRVLRAGDVIEYCPHNLVNTSANRRQAVITQVMSKKDTFCLELQDGALLQSDHQIKLVQRRIRGKLQDNADAVTLDVGQFRLDASGNGKLKIETFADHASNLMAQGNRRIEEGFVDIYNPDAEPFQSVDSNASKRHRDEDSMNHNKEEGTVSTKKTKGGLLND